MMVTKRKLKTFSWLLDLGFVCGGSETHYEKKKEGNQKRSKRTLISAGVHTSLKILFLNQTKVGGKVFIQKLFHGKYQQYCFQKEKQKAIMGMEESFMLCAIPVNHTSSRHVSGQPGCQQAAHETEQELKSCMAYQLRSQAGVSALLWPHAGSWRGRRESTPKQEEPAARLLL